MIGIRRRTIYGVALAVIALILFLIKVSNDRIINASDGPYETVEGADYVISIHDPHNPIGRNTVYDTLMIEKGAKISNSDIINFYLCPNDLSGRVPSVQTQCIVINQNKSSTSMVERSELGDLVGLYDARNEPNVSLALWEEKQSLWHDIKPMGEHFIQDLASPDGRFTVIFSASMKSAIHRYFTFWGSDGPRWISQRYYAGIIYMELYDCATSSRMALLKRPFQSIDAPNPIMPFGWWDNASRIFECYDSIRWSDYHIMLIPRVEGTNEESNPK